MRVTPDDGPHLRVPGDDGIERVGVLQAERVESGCLHGYGLVMQADQHVTVTVRRQLRVEPLQFAWAEPPLAVRGVGEPRVQHDDGPVAGDPRATHLEGLMRQTPHEFGRHVVVAGDQQHGCAEAVEQQFERTVGRRILLHEVARDRDQVRRQVATPGMGEAGLQARQRANPAQLRRRIRQQVGIGELQQSNHQRCRV